MADNERIESESVEHRHFGLISHHAIPVPLSEVETPPPVAPSPSEATSEQENVEKETAPSEATPEQETTPSETPVAHLRGDAPSISPEGLPAKSDADPPADSDAGSSTAQTGSDNGSPKTAQKEEKTPHMRGWFSPRSDGTEDFEEYDRSAPHLRFHNPHHAPGHAPHHAQHHAPHDAPHHAPRHATGYAPHDARGYVPHHAPHRVPEHAPEYAPGHAPEYAPGHAPDYAAHHAAHQHPSPSSWGRSPSEHEGRQHHHYGHPASQRTPHQGGPSEGKELPSRKRHSTTQGATERHAATQAQKKQVSAIPAKVRAGFATK